MKIWNIPIRSYLVGATLTMLLIFSFLGYQLSVPLYLFALLGSLPVFIESFKSVGKFRINIEVFNAFVLIVAFLIGDPDSAAFIVLMLTFADYLDFLTETRAHRAIEELLKLNPETATREIEGRLEDINTKEIVEGDIIVVKSGDRVPVDGIIVYGRASMNEASVSGESMPVDKVIGEEVFSSTLNESGLIKIKAVGVGKNSTIERVAKLIESASLHKSKKEKLADKFATIFLPAIILLGGVTYYFTHDIKMVAALFLVSCADDMAVAIPLAMTASLGRAARRGVIIKGGEWLSAMANIETIVFDKTGTLTYGVIEVERVNIDPSVDEKYFWKMVGSAEKYSEHPIGKAIFKKALEQDIEIQDPDSFERYGSKGILAKLGDDEVVVGNENIFVELGLDLGPDIESVISEIKGKDKRTTTLVYINRKFAGVVSVADVVNVDATKSIKSLQKIGVKNVKMFTGDTEEVASDVAGELGISNFSFKMTPESKLFELEKLTKLGSVAMVGDGINDAPALARSDVGIAMGSTASAVALEAADVVILSNKLDRIPEMIKLSRKTESVIKIDILIWVITNIVGIALVFGGVIGPIFAAFYNFITDFFPLLNSSRLFREKP